MLMKERRSNNMQSKRFYPASAEYVSLIRLTFWRFSRLVLYIDIEDAKIAVSEAVTNAVKHAYKEKTMWALLTYILKF